MTIQELEIKLQQGHTLRAVTEHDNILTARHLNDQHYTISRITNRGIRASILEYKTARGAVRKMLFYTPADRREVVS